MDLSTVNHYIYEPLHHPRNIRLMILQPSDDPDSALEFLFSQEHISHFRGQYEALSYTWGEARFLHSVYHLGSEKSLLSITSNLHEALLRLRYSHKPRVLWVDAVCINQTDDVEKALQIPLMAHIFRGAYRVMAWLGPVESGSAAERGMNVLSNVSSRWTDPRDRQLGYEMGFDDFAALNPSTDFQTQMDSVGELLSLPWFSRLCM